MLPGEHVRAFPLSDWTELDIWQYIAREGIELPPIYFAHRRPVVERDGMLLALGEWVAPGRARRSRRRACVSAPSATPPAPGRCAPRRRPSSEIIAEVATARISERGATRADDRFSETAMEDRKREGYF